MRLKENRMGQRLSPWRVGGADEDAFDDLLFDQIKKPALMIRTDYRVLRANRAAAEALGHERQHLVGLPLPDVVGRFHFEGRLKPGLERCLRGEEAQAWHCSMAATTEELDLGLSMMPLRRDDGMIVGAIVTSIDASEQDKVVQAVEAQQALYRGLVEDAVVGIAFRRGEKLIFANQAMVRMFGYEAAGELLQMDHFLGIVAPHDRGRIRGYAEIRDAGRQIPQPYEFDGQRRDGEVIHVLGSCSKLVWEGEPAMLHILADITKQKKAERALVEERNLLRSIIDNIPDAIYAKDRHARYILKNRFDASMMGVDDPEEPIGKTDFDYYPKAVAEGLYQDDLQVIEEGKPLVGKVEQIMRGGDGAPVWYNTSKLPLHDAEGEIMGLVGIGRDVTEAKRLSDRLHYQATHDGLTNLINRREFERLLELAMKAAKVSARPSVLCYLDLDQFKVVNDSVGHIAGDRLLCEVAALLSEHIDPAHATLARLGGDEFGLLLDDCLISCAEAIADDLVNAFGSYRFSWEGRVFNISASIGIAAINNELKEVSDALSQADIACYAAKDGGRNRWHAYRSSDVELRRRHDELLQAASLKAAIENDRFCLFVQPIACLNTPGRPVRHYEILLRLQGEDGELMSPGAFIPAAERYGLMVNIDDWVVNKVFDLLPSFAGLKQKLQFNVNLSGHSLTDQDFQTKLRDRLAAATMPLDRLCFEITETAVISHLGRAKRFIADMRALGCRFALDDFGCGLSSFNYLKQFQVDFLKIDGCFIRDIARDKTDRAMVKAINDVGHILGMKTVAEFVQDEDSIQHLTDLQIDLAQGYVIGEPRPVADLAEAILTRAS